MVTISALRWREFQAYLFSHRTFEESGEEGEPHLLGGLPLFEDPQPLAMDLGLRNEAIKRHSMTLGMMDRSRVVLIK